MARAVPLVLRHTTWCGCADRPVNAQARGGDGRDGWRDGRPERTASSNTVTPGKVAENVAVVTGCQCQGVRELTQDNVRSSCHSMQEDRMIGSDVEG
jgi:hypothetical protein